MCIYLSAAIVEQVQEELLQAYSPETPVAACYKLTWKEEKIYRGKLKDLAQIVRDNHLTLTTLLVVGNAIDHREGLSRLYADEFKQGSKSQMVVTDNLSKIFQLAAIYLFFFPSEFVAGSYGRFGRVGLQEFFLYLLHNSST